MKVQRKDVVLVDFPFTDGSGSKVRPALVIQNDRDNNRLVNTIVAQISGTTHRALEPTQAFIDLKTPDGKLSGLRFDSVVNCANVVTLELSLVHRKLGELSDTMMNQVDLAIKEALEIA